MLRLELLGPPHVTFSGRAVKLGAKPLFLLAYLALEGRSSRRTLAALLWPQAPNALNNLSVARNGLEKSMAGALAPDLETMALAEGFSCDVLEFRTCLGRDDARAWSLWRGGFLTSVRLTDWEAGLGEEFEEWLFSTRETLQRQRRELALRLTTMIEDLETARQYLLVAHEGEEPIEEATRRLILVLGALERPTEAVQAFAHLTRVLREELGVDPTGETRQALEMARSDPRACRDAIQARTKTTAKPRVVGEVPFVGRGSELGSLEQWLQEATTETRVALITGEPGGGKTRLALEVAGKLEGQREWFVSHLICPPGALSLAALDAFARNQIERPSRLERLPADARAALQRFLNLETASDALAPQLERRALFTALRSLLEHETQPSLVILDDLQWADETTVEFLHFLLARPPQHGLALIVTQRSTEAAHADLNALLMGLARAGQLLRLPLEPLLETDIASLATALEKQVDVAHLTHASGGNPFYVLELLCSDGTHSTRVNELVRARLDALPEVARQTLEALAVTGNEARAALLRDVSGRSLEEASEALEVLLHAQLVRVHDDRVRFSHDLVRETVQAHLTGLRAPLLHLRAARASKNLPLEAAPHHWAAREVWDEGDVQHAVLAFLEVGHTLGFRGDFTGSLEWFDRALEVTPDQLRARTLIEQANTLERFGRHAPALEALDAAEWFLENDPVLHARAFTARGRIMQRVLRQPETAQVALERALELLQGQRGRDALAVQSDATHLLGSVAYNQARYQDALALYERAHQLRKTLGDKYRIAESLGGVALAADELERPDAQKHLLACLQLREEIGDLYGVGRALNNLASFHQRRGRLPEALDVQTKALELNERLESPVDYAIALNNIGAIHFDMGDLSKALELYTSALEHLEQHGMPPRPEFVANLEEAQQAIRGS